MCISQVTATTLVLKINHHPHHHSIKHKVLAQIQKNWNQHPWSKSSIMSNKFVHRNLTPPFTNFIALEHQTVYQIGHIILSSYTNAITIIIIHYQYYLSYPTSLSTVIWLHHSHCTWALKCIRSVTSSTQILNIMIRDKSSSSFLNAPGSSTSTRRQSISTIKP